MPDVSNLHSSIDHAVTATGWIHVASGRQVSPLQMTVDQLDIVDIAHSLARLCRYNGHCAGFLSVAEHSVKVMARVAHAHRPAVGQDAGQAADVRRKLLRTALMHDATEAYLGDLVRPLKKLPEFEFFVEAEDRLAAVIAERYDLHYGLPAEVVQADDDELRYELEVSRHEPGGWSVDEAERAFLSAWETVAP